MQGQSAFYENVRFGHLRLEQVETEAQVAHRLLIKDHVGRFSFV